MLFNHCIRMASYGWKVILLHFQHDRRQIGILALLANMFFKRLGECRSLRRGPLTPAGFTGWGKALLLLEH